jgi:formamidopyrimidine-DNA glycosylase
MPELPDITVYLEALEERLAGRRLERIRLYSPFLLRSVAPPLAEFHGRAVTGFRRIGKRLALGFEDEHWLVLHLMIAGRLHWKKAGAPLHGKQNLAAFEFAHGSLTLTEAGSKRRASLTAARGEPALAALDPGGLEVMDCALEAFRERLTAENHTVKRALTDPRIFAGIGNAYSDEILHEARLSPIVHTRKLTEEETGRLLGAIRVVMRRWIDLLRGQARGGFPEGVTAFRPEMAVHGKYGAACPRCGAKIQRIRYAANETNYCPECQTGGRLLADRALSRLLGSDWPRSLEELESLMKGHSAP